MPLDSSMDVSHHLSRLAVTRYWHFERFRNIFGLTPPGVPQWLQRFDWLVGWEHGWAPTNQSPRHVYCHPMATDGLLRYLRTRKAPQLLSDSFLVIGGEDTLLSGQNQETLSGLSDLFCDLYYEAYDIENPSVKIMPIGLQENYLRGAEEDFFKLVDNPLPKTELVLCAFGSFWPELDRSIDDRASAIKSCTKMQFVEMGPFEREEYYSRLSLSKFMVCPRGNGVQAPKIIEALLNRCIPLMTDSVAARKLSELGIPMLIVDKWDDLTQELLDSRYETLKSEVDTFFAILSDMDRWWEFSFNRTYQP